MSTDALPTLGNEGPMGEGLSPDAYTACQLCPHRCRVDRTQGQKGFCGAGAVLRINDAMPHFGEEAVLVGEGGSGAIFFSHCTLRCVYCQTAEMSWRGEGTDTCTRRLADLMLELQQDGCHNINLITATHFLPHVVHGIRIARARGLTLPIVYNTSSYERVDILRMLEGLIDIYLADLKYVSPDLAQRLSGAEDYPRVACDALVEMHRQVGDLATDGRGIARRGLMVRHLVLPHHLEETRAVLGWIASHLPPHTHVTLMGHYRPCHLARDLAPLNRPLTEDEYRAAQQAAREAGLTRLDRTHERLYPLLWHRPR
ncbi:putative pyruvate formate lyase activating enzyme [Desulfacinum hydrothermale DSM 13146]|uniref:Putative pyruvate formate lyase activating enzyme n=1 Tax=Desulfacinum hydrothermale DSM 13146 TaxID=1121390 RepID=A0A1W1XTT5_9BACT|nr:radical SAM protein [Desulfacinum hydrothermale]SMC27400.1 putative pyruvate formate lyase activating enzyme [Desulfacinum hydrothermale DSM 13146]